MMKGGKMKKQDTAIQITAIISGVVLIIAFAFLYTFNSVIDAGEDTVNVEGLATIKAMPDEIGIYFNIETIADTTAQASEANAEILDKLVTVLEAEGFERSEIVTQNYNIYPNYDWDDGDRKEEGFRATHSIRVKVDATESEKASKVIDAGAQAGAGISYINFELSQESQNFYKAEAMKLAAQDAKIKAEAMAEGFDKKVGKLVSTSVNDFGYYPWNVYSKGSLGIEEDYAEARSVASDIQPGEQEITSRISAVFKLK